MNRKGRSPVKRVLLALTAILVTLLGFLLLSLQPPPELQPSATAFSLTDVTVINPMRGRTVSGLSVAEGKIQSASRDATELTEYRGHYVLPGLIDMHAHLPAGNALRLSEYFGLLNLAFGVTSLRSVGDLDGTAEPAMRDGIASGAFPGPRVFSCGAFVVGGLPLRWPNSVMVERPEDADAVVKELKNEGNVCIKSYEDLDAAKLRALQVSTSKYGMRMVGHVPHGLTYEQGLIPEVQHYLGVPAVPARDHMKDRAIDWRSVDSERLDEVVAATLRHGTINTPTLVSTAQLQKYQNYKDALKSPPARLLPRFYAVVAWHPSEGIPYWKGIESDMAIVEDAHHKKLELTRRLYKAGAALHLGTDSMQPFVAPGLGMQQEMQQFAKADIPLEAIWAMATWKAADTFGLPLLGTLIEDAPADFLIFSEDPTADLNALSSLKAVVANGRLYRREDLDAAMQTYQAHFNRKLFDAVSIPAARITLHKDVLRDY